MQTNPHASHDRALVEAAGETSPWFADRRAEWLNYIEKKGALSERMRESATREVNLAKALEVADARVLVDAYFPEAGVDLGRSRQRIKAVWRDGDGLNVVLDSKRLYDFVTGQSYTTLTFFDPGRRLERRRGQGRATLPRGLQLDQTPVHPGHPVQRGS